MHRTSHAQGRPLRNTPDLSGGRNKNPNRSHPPPIRALADIERSTEAPVSFPAGAGTVDFGGTGTCGCTGRASIGVLTMHRTTHAQKNLLRNTPDLSGDRNKKPKPLTSSTNTGPGGYRALHRSSRYPSLPVPAQSTSAELAPVVAPAAQA
eukprot:CAMPEP_0204249318 /NCGR_PEP_ID=MMETSP0361-20130328/99605_1 /ASSEMBLY_ACC=CAM_ASM_000343 /TAXON_ID=268821 /ORGANISM="Scrippsiella Hangoei, Strain SHTV-5" /LENGTH=150 /DNA_ID=CAMNT_0051222587 /DNA_START=432 /DNA_END=885 /DNA_ORIENTATION=-